MAAVNLLRAPVWTLPEHYPLQTETAACRIPIKDGNTEEWDTVVEHSPESLGSSPDNPVEILSDDDDEEDRSDDGFPSLSEVAASNTPETPREPGAPATPGSSSSLEARPDNVDDAPRQVQMYDGTKGDRMAKSLPETQAIFEATAIIISEDEDEDEEWEEEEMEEEEEDDYQFDAVCPLPLETDAFGVSRGGQEISSAHITDLGALENPIKRGYVLGQSSQADAHDIQQSTPRPKAHIESQDPLFVTPGACSSALSLKRQSEDDEGDNGQDTAGTSGMKYSSPMHLPDLPKNKPLLSSHGRRAQAVYRVNDRARGDRRKSNLLKRRLQPQVADSDSESTWDNGDKDYSPLHMKAAEPQHKRRKVSSHLCHDTVPSPVRHTRKRLATRDSSRRPATDSGQARYEEWPVHNTSLDRVIDAGIAVFQHQFDQDLLHHYRKTYATSLPDREESDILAQDTIGSEEELYDVEEILDWAWEDDTQQMKYLIKWEGYDGAENTWEPLINLTQCQAQLAQFHCRRESTGPRGPEERAWQDKVAPLSRPSGRN